MKFDIFVQARLNSTRLPNKILKKICEKSVLELMKERMAKINNINKVIVVTGDRDQNCLLINECERLNLEYFCGNATNILDRFYNASLYYNSQNIIRLTGDNPILEFNLINKGIDLFKKNTFDIISNDRVLTFPIGINFQIFTKEVLDKSWNDVLSSFPNKNLFKKTFIPPTKYMMEQDQFKHYVIKSNKKSLLRLTMDYPEDYTVIKTIFTNLYPKNSMFTLDDVFDFMTKNPEIVYINKKYANENKSSLSLVK